MQCRNEENVVVSLNLVGFLAFKLPVRIVDEDKNAGPSVAIPQQS